MLHLNRPFRELKLYKIIAITVILLYSCNQQREKTNNKQKQLPLIIEKSTPRLDSFSIKYEKTLQKAGLINLFSIDSDIVVSLRYASTNNFLKTNFYHSFNGCYLHLETAKKLKQAQKYIQMSHSGCRLIIFDATRPCSIQQYMWDSSKLSLQDKRKFLANPQKHSLHSFGLAVDCSIVDKTGKEIDMGTEVDFAGEKAYPSLENVLLQKNILTQKQIDNRKILRWAMLKAQFYSNPFEWWHFNTCSRMIAEKTAACIVDFNTFVFPENNVISDCKNTSEIIYKVQIAAMPYQMAKNDSIAYELHLDCYRQDALFKYTVGRYKRIQDAYKLQDSLVKVGFLKAFIVCFKDGKRIMVKDNMQY
jgi:D-alanyl-D-alanine dipeptidase